MYQILNIKPQGERGVGGGGGGGETQENLTFFTEPRVKFPTPGHLVNIKILPLNTFSLSSSHSGIC